MPVDAHGREPGEPGYEQPAEVDEDGRPESPTEQAVEKRKNANRTKAGLALAAIGIVVAIVLARNHANAQAAAAGTPTSGVPFTDSSAGTGGPGSADTSALAQLSGEFSTAQALNAQHQQQLLHKLAQEQAAIAALERRLAALAHAQKQGGASAPEHRHLQATPRNLGSLPGYTSPAAAGMAYGAAVMADKVPWPKGVPVPAGYHLGPKGYVHKN